MIVEPLGTVISHSLRGMPLMEQPFLYVMSPLLDVRVIMYS